MNAETLQNWIRRQQLDDGQRYGVSSETAVAIRASCNGSLPESNKNESLTQQSLSSCGKAARTGRR
jgi:hypothetical protein